LPVESSTIYDNPITGYLNQPLITQNLGALSPFFSLATNGSGDTPPGCSITFAQILSRHGARFPTSGNAARIQTALAKAQVALRNSSLSLPSKYEFLTKFTYTLGEDNLTHFGQQELVNSGLKFFDRYGALGNVSAPFVRASGSARVIESAQNFTQGFNAAASNRNATTKLVPANSILVIPEVETSNNTLKVETCNAFGNDTPFDTIGDDQDQIWTNIFAAPITARLNADLPGANLNVNDTVAIMDMCPFETVATPNGAISPFCSLFIDDEWESYEFLQDLDKYFGNGPGNGLGRTQGVGWVNELLARLTNTAVVDHTSTNTTLDSSNSTFPLGLALYADFSHDTQLTSIFSALGLFNSTVVKGGLNATDRNSSKTSEYTSFQTVPFSARAYVEKMICNGTQEEMVRILVNDAVQPLEFCGGDEYGRCTLSNFVESQEYAKSGGEWTEC
jgi:hypothetical protein